MSSECDVYYHRYTSLVPDGDVIATLEREFPRTRALLETVPAARESWAYEPGKWTFREVTGHLADTERVFSDRALWIARDPSTALPSLEQNVWATNSNARRRPLSELLDEWSSVRAATLTLVRSFDADALMRVGTASGKRFTVRSFAWIIAGHELHHRKLLQQRYGLEEPMASPRFLLRDLVAELRIIGGGTEERHERARRAAAAIARVGGYRWVGLYDVGAANISVIGWAGPSAPTYPTFPRSQGLNGAAVATGEPVIVQDVSLDSRYLSTLGSTRAEMIMPVRTLPDGDVVGTIDVESDQVNPFTVRDSVILRAAADALRELWSGDTTAR